MAALARLNKILWCNTISFANKSKLYKSLVTLIILYGCETWKLLTDSEKMIQASKTKCLTKLLCISYLEPKTNNWVQSKINFLVGPKVPLLATVRRWKLAWFRHVTHPNSLSKTIPQGTLEGGWHQSWQLVSGCFQPSQPTSIQLCTSHLTLTTRGNVGWTNIKEWTSLPMSELLTKVCCRKDWKRISTESSFMSPRPPNQSWDWSELNYKFKY